MAKKLLLAVDHAVEASRSMQRVTDLCGREPCEVVVLHVHQVAYGHTGRFIVEGEPDEDCIADVVARTLRASGVAATSLTVERPFGEVAQAIAETAGSVGAGLVLVGAPPSWMDPTAVKAGLAGELRLLIGASADLVAVP